MCKNGLVFFAIIALCYCQNTSNNNLSLDVNKRHPYHHHDPYYHHYHELLYGGGLLYYLTFILIKVKVVFVLGTIFTIFLVAGKFLAIIKYAEYMKESPKHHHEHEKVYVHEPTPHDYYPSHFSSPTEGEYYDSPPSHYSRNFRNELRPNYYELFLEMIRKFNTTEKSFKTININSTACKKKFVCKTDYKAKYSRILALGLSLLRDEEYDMYKTNKTIKSLAECDQLYQNCKNVNI